MSFAFRLEDSAHSHVGHVREENEDTQLSLPYQGIWLVADGMGGYENGQFASSTIAEAVGAIDAPEDLQLACDAVAAAIRTANAAILAQSRLMGQQMGSTVVALVIRGGEFAVLWAGDSRAYVYRDNMLVQLTRDHSTVQDMLERGLLTAEEAASHPMRHVLSRAIGVQDHVMIDAVRDEIVAKDIFLLCSDGLHGVLSDDEIAESLARLGPHAGAELIAACLARGAPDNVTIALVGANEPTLLTFGGAPA